MLLEAHKLSIGYGGRPLLSDIELSIEQGDWWGVVGPNGAGKTTLLSIIAGTQSASSGSVPCAPMTPFWHSMI